MAISLQKSPASLNRGTAELLMDLVEIKLGCMEVWDREDARELRALEKARVELAAVLGRPAPQPIAVISAAGGRRASPPQRSEEHTSELQSLMRISYAVFCLKKNKNNTKINATEQDSQHIIQLI